MLKTNLHQTIATACPICGELLEVVDAHINEQVECPECGELFRVVSLGPLQLAYAYDLGEESEFLEKDKPHL
jgi:lysine biosynthesis protein LysW